jgi:hypothetical protein
VLGTRLHLLLRLLPYAAPRVADPLSSLAFRALPTASRCLHHPRNAISRAAHVAHVAVFRAHPSLHAAAFPPYLAAALAGFPATTPAEPFVAAVGTVAKHGVPGSRLAARAARMIGARAAELDRAAAAALPGQGQAQMATSLTCCFNPRTLS